MEQPKVQAVTHRAGVSIAIAEGVSGGRGEARGILESVDAEFPELELIAHEQTSDAHGAIVWMGSREDVESLARRFRELRGPGGEWKLSAEHDAAFVSLIGLGLGARQAAAAEHALERAGVPLIALRVTPAALILRVPAERCETAVQALHAALVAS